MATRSYINIMCILMLIIHIAMQSDAIFYFNIPRQFTWLYSIYYKCISIIFIFFPHHVKFEMFSLKSRKMPHTSHTKRNHVQITLHQTKPAYWALYCALLYVFACVFACLHACVFVACVCICVLYKNIYEFYTGTDRITYGVYICRSQTYEIIMIAWQTWSQIYCLYPENAKFDGAGL